MRLHLTRWAWRLAAIRSRSSWGRGSFWACAGQVEDKKARARPIRAGVARTRLRRIGGMFLRPTTPQWWPSQLLKPLGVAAAFIM